jgi:hypothetical protein
MSVYENCDYLDDRFNKFLEMLYSIEQHAIDIIQSNHSEGNMTEIAYNTNRIVDIVQNLIVVSDPWVCVGSYKFDIVDKLIELDKKSNYYLEIQKKIEAIEEDDINNYYDYDEEKDDENRLDFKTLLDHAGVATIDDLFFD